MIVGRRRILRLVAGGPGVVAVLAVVFAAVVLAAVVLAVLAVLAAVILLVGPGWLVAGLLRTVVVGSIALAAVIGLLVGAACVDGVLGVAADDAQGGADDQRSNGCT